MPISAAPITAALTPQRWYPAAGSSITVRIGGSSLSASGGGMSAPGAKRGSGAGENGGTGGAGVTGCAGTADSGVACRPGSTAELLAVSYPGAAPGAEEGAGAEAAADSA